MTIKLGIIVAAALVVATPLALLARSRDAVQVAPMLAGPMRIPEAVRAALQVPCTVKADHIPLGEAVAFATESCHVRVSVDPTLAASPVTVIEDHLTVEGFLDRAAAQAGGVCTWRDGGMEIVTLGATPRTSTGPASAEVKQTSAEQASVEPASAEQASMDPAETGAPQIPPNVLNSPPVYLKTDRMSAGYTANLLGKLSGLQVGIDPSLATNEVSVNFQDEPLDRALVKLADLVGGTCVWRTDGALIVPRPAPDLAPPAPRANQ